MLISTRHPRADPLFPNAPLLVHPGPRMASFTPMLVRQVRVEQVGEESAFQTRRHGVSMSEHARRHGCARACVHAHTYTRTHAHTLTRTHAHSCSVLSLGFQVSGTEHRKGNGGWLLLTAHLSLAVLNCLSTPSLRPYSSLLYSGSGAVVCRNWA